MFKFKLGRKQSDEPDSHYGRVQPDLVALKKLTDRGFPSHPSSMAYDSQLHMISIGTQTGEIRM
jgi:hypothetical protein